MYYIRRLWYLVIPQLFYRFCYIFSNTARSMLQKNIRAQLLPNISLDLYFVSRYNPWDQRLCICPDRDFFRAVQSTKAKVETGVIKIVNRDGIQLVSGKQLDTDIIITATGLRIQFFGGISIYIQGKKLDTSEKYT